LIAQYPDATVASVPVLPDTSNLPSPGSAGNERRTAAAIKTREAAVSSLERHIQDRAEDASVLRLSAAHKRAAGDEQGATRYERQSEAADQAQRVAETSLQTLRDAPLPQLTEPGPAQADFATPAAVIAALTGPFATGPAPKALRTALNSIGASSSRLEEIDATRVRLSLT